MAVGINAIVEIRPGATAGNLNGCGFNPEATGLLTDLTCDAGTGNTSAPVVSSASYNFVAGDVGAYVFIPSGTNSRPGWYLISSVASNKATLSAASGASVWYTSGAARSLNISTAAGIATTGTPTGLTFTIDYSQQDSHKLSLTDLACTTGSTNVTSATASFTPVMVGNWIRLNSATGVGTLLSWYEITAYTNTTTLVIDRTCAPTNNMTAGNFRIGGAGSLNQATLATDDSLFEMGRGTNASGATRFYIKSGTYATVATVSIASTGGSQAPVMVIGYNSLRTDGMASSLGVNRPTLNVTTAAFSPTANWDFYNLIFTGSATSVLSVSTNNKCIWVKGLNTSTTAGRAAFLAAANDYFFYQCEGISYRGQAFNTGAFQGNFFGCYAHDSDIGYNSTATGGFLTFHNCVSANNVTYGLRFAGAITGPVFVNNCTFYGGETQIGAGISCVSGVTDVRVTNSSVSGFTTGMEHADVQSIFFGSNNNFYNNGTNVSNFALSPTDTTLDPAFVSVTEIAGTSGTSSTTVLTDATKDFSSVIDNQDFAYLVSGTGSGFGVGKYLITSHTTTTLTLSSNITSSGSGTSIVYRVGLGHNYAIGTNLRALGSPGTFPGELTTGYLDVGAVQRRQLLPGYTKGRVVNA